MPGPRNVADGLTKYLAVQDLMVAVVSAGRYTIADVETVVARAAAVKDTYRRRRKKATKPEESQSKENTLGVKPEGACC